MESVEDIQIVPNEILYYIVELCPRSYRDMISLPVIARDNVLRTKILRASTLITVTYNLITFTIGGKYHREDGPAVICYKGGFYQTNIKYVKFECTLVRGGYLWCKRGVPHRIGGPALFDGHDIIRWYENGLAINNFPEKNGPVAYWYTQSHCKSGPNGAPRHVNIRYANGSSQETHVSNAHRFLPKNDFAWIHNINFGIGVTPKFLRIVKSFNDTKYNGWFIYSN